MRPDAQALHHGRRVYDDFRSTTVHQAALHGDERRREQAVAHNAEYIAKCAAYGSINYFLVMLPENHELPRAENFGYMVEGFRLLAPVLEKHNARIATGFNHNLTLQHCSRVQSRSGTIVKT